MQMKNHNNKVPRQYRIKVKGCLDEKWEEWFDGMVISHEGAYTNLKGEIADQSALHGLLARIRDLNLNLVYLECLKNN
jgi:hypothetical protein